MPTIKKRGRGRPRKSELEKAKRPGKVGRPKGEAGIMADYRARMLASPKSEAVLESILDAALNNEHKHQAAAWKLVVDRILPVSMFEKTVGSGKPQVNISITTADGSVNVSGSDSSDAEQDYIDGELVKDDDEGLL